jgi:hypothetical protein
VTLAKLFAALGLVALVALVATPWLLRRAGESWWRNRGRRIDRAVEFARVAALLKTSSAALAKSRESLEAHLNGGTPAETLDPGHGRAIESLREANRFLAEVHGALAAAMEPHLDKLDGHAGLRGLAAPVELNTQALDALRARIELVGQLRSVLDRYYESIARAYARGRGNTPTSAKAASVHDPVLLQVAIQRLLDAPASP